MSEESDFDSDNTLDYEDPVQVKHINIKRYISSAKSILQGVNFEPYQRKILVDWKMDTILTHKGTSIDPCYINKLDDAMFDHFKLKQQVKQAIHGKDDNTKLSQTLTQKFNDRLPIYQKFATKNKKYFATEIVSLKPGKKNYKHSNKFIGSSHIQFDSDFQSGNLFKAYKVNQNHYQLVLQNDINTKGYNQWFFFRVKGLPKNKAIKFQIINLVKKDSLFNEGLKPTVFSKMRFQKRGVGWVRQGQKVHYYPNQITQQNGKTHYYSLSFQYKSMYDQDEVYFSHSFPYTFSDFGLFMKNILSKTYSYLHLSLGTLSQTLSGNRVDILTITGKNYNKNKKSVWIIARQHPGEVTGSFMVQGIIELLLQQTPLSQYLREKVIFKIIPMMNPDGVIYGNSRCQIVGSDSNRKWKCPSNIINPIIHQVRQQILKSSNNIDLFLDLHSHSRKFSCFFYGNPVPEKQKSRIYPLLVSNNDEKFSFNSSRFSDGCKKSARYVLHRILNIPNIFTVQSSFYGYQKNNRIIQYLPHDYKQMGKSLMQSYARMLGLQSTNIQKLSLNKALNKLESQPKLIEFGDKQSIGSDQDPCADDFDASELQKLLPKSMQILKRKKKISKKTTIQAIQLPKKSKPKRVKSRQRVKQQKKPVKNPSDLFKKRYSLVPIKRNCSIDQQNHQLVKRQLYVFNPSHSTHTQQFIKVKTQKDKGNEYPPNLCKVVQTQKVLRCQRKQILAESKIQSQLAQYQYSHVVNRLAPKRNSRTSKILSQLKQNRTQLKLNFET